MRHRKAEPMRLTGTVIGVLSQNHNFHFIKRGQIKGRKNLAARWIDALACGLFSTKELSKRHHVGGCKLISQPCLPAGIHLHIGGCGIF